MKLIKALLGVAAMFVVVASANSQTIAVNGIGSSALFLELGQAASQTSSIGAVCTWTASKGVAYATDTRTGVGYTEAGQFWVAWKPTGTDCSTPTGSVYSYLQTDSTVGDRCIFASPACTLTVPASAAGTGGAGLLGTTDKLLPSAIQTLLNGSTFNVAGTDIRPEDAKFATIRALTDCGVAVNGGAAGSAGSQYLGLGYATGTGSHIGSAIKGSTVGLGGSFNVVDFNLTGHDPINTSNTVPSWNVYDVGLVPVVVIVNPTNVSGFGSTFVQNVTRGELAGYLDGTYGVVADLVSNQAYSSSGIGAVATKVFLREPLSGTYNVMEYSIPNSVELQTSQDVGYVQSGIAASFVDSTGTGVTISSANNCNGTAVGQNPLAAVSSRANAGASYRYRAIGTGNEISAVYATTDSLGYAFWGASNFAKATASNARYLTVDGVDPLQQVWTDGLVPTSKNGLLGNISFANVKNGSYPIWSKLRLAATTNGEAGASALANAAQNFVSPSQPDFVPINQVFIVRSHFVPPYNASSAYNADFPGSGTLDQPANGTAQCGSTEAGGDVAGLIYSVQSDGDFCADAGSSYGNTGRRQ